MPSNRRTKVISATSNPKRRVKARHKRPHGRANALSKPLFTFFNLSKTFDALAQILRPLGSRTYGVTLNRPISETYNHQFDQAIEAFKPLIKDLSNRGIRKRAVWSILERYHSPLDRDTIEMLSTGLAEAREAIQQEIKARNQLQRHVGFVKTPPIPESLQKDILEDTTQALNILKQDKTGIEKAQQEVQSLRHITRLSQNPSIRRTEQELVGVMAKAGMAHKEALGITHKLLQAWDSTRSSASVESLRVGLSRSKKR